MFKRRTKTQTYTEPRFVVKVKQNRYEKYIVDELRVSADTTEDLLANLVASLDDVVKALDEVNA